MGPAGSLLGDTVVFWSVPWGWQGGFRGTQSSFYPKLLGLKIDLVLVRGRIKGVRVGAVS